MPRKLALLGIIMTAGHWNAGFFGLIASIFSVAAVAPRPGQSDPFA